MKVTPTIPRKPKDGNGYVKNDEGTRHKCFMTTMPQEWDKEEDTTVKAKAPPTSSGKQSFEDQYFLFKGDEVPEKYILWMIAFEEKLVTKKPDWGHVWESIDKLTNA